ncbi:phosphatidylglycerol lysyltransferase domain-containing protein [Rhizobium sp. CC-YZS058]|uniref:phosphatidylglycerol lysyltransferase domain-containing protein n=1 Tax=Rhizobium sp. CC-YZS058 TaxID=3042153 RepID=UPI003A4C600D
MAVLSARRIIDAALDSRLPAVAETGLCPSRRLALCRQHGDFSVAYSAAMQQGLRYFGDEAGYLAYATKMGHSFVLGDPVAAPEARETYLRAFVAEAKAPCFVQIGPETAQVLAGLGYRINQIGIDTVLAFDRHSFAGKRNETVRYSERWLIKQGYRLVECDGTVGERAALKALSKKWRAGRVVHRREMAFLNRPFLSELMPDMRRFLVLHPGGEPMAVIDFDPIFRDGKVIGYTTAFKRRLPDASSHAEIGLTKFAADRFRSEGHERLTLGLSPLASLGPSGYPESAVWAWLFSRAYASPRINARFFNLQGQAAFKRRFHGEEVPTYIAFKRRTPLEMLALLRVLKTM